MKKGRKAKDTHEIYLYDYSVEPPAVTYFNGYKTLATAFQALMILVDIHRRKDVEIVDNSLLFRESGKIRKKWSIREI